MVIQDIADAYKENGLGRAVGVGIPAFFGVGTQTYAPTAKQIVPLSKRIQSYYKELINQGKINEASALYLKNKDILIMGEKLEGIQKQIDAYKRLKTEIEKNVKLTSTQKQQMTKIYDQILESLNERLEKNYEFLKEEFK